MQNREYKLIMKINITFYNKIRLIEEIKNI